MTDNSISVPLTVDRFFGLLNNTLKLENYAEWSALINMTLYSELEKYAAIADEIYKNLGDEFEKWRELKLRPYLESTLEYPESVSKILLSLEGHTDSEWLSEVDQLEKRVNFANLGEEKESIEDLFKRRKDLIESINYNQFKEKLEPYNKCLRDYLRGLSELNAAANELRDHIHNKPRLFSWSNPLLYPIKRVVWKDKKKNTLDSLKKSHSAVKSDYHTLSVQVQNKYPKKVVVLPLSVAAIPELGEIVENLESKDPKPGISYDQEGQIYTVRVKPTTEYGMGVDELRLNGAFDSNGVSGKVDVNLLNIVKKGLILTELIRNDDEGVEVKVTLNLPEDTKFKFLQVIGRYSPSCIKKRTPLEYVSLIKETKDRK